MSKTFNGQKMSHGIRQGYRKSCPICSTSLIRFRGILRCTEIKSSKRKGGNSYRVVKHGSVRTASKRAQQQAAAK